MDTSSYMNKVTPCIHRGRRKTRPSYTHTHTHTRVKEGAENGLKLNSLNNEKPISDKNT